MSSAPLQGSYSALRSPPPSSLLGTTGGASLRPPSVPSSFGSWQSGTVMKVGMLVVVRASEAVQVRQVYLPWLYFSLSETITALFKTRFRLDFPFDLQELPAFAVIG